MPCLTTQVDISNANGGSIVDTIQRQHRGCIWRNVAVGERVPRCLFSRTKTYLRLAMAPHHPSVQSDISRPRRTSRYMCFCSFLSSSLHGPKTVLPLHVHLLLPQHNIKLDNKSTPLSSKASPAHYTNVSAHNPKLVECNNISVLLSRISMILYRTVTSSLYIQRYSSIYNRTMQTCVPYLNISG